MISVTSLANTFILFGKQEGIVVTPMKLQRLLYLTYKKYLKDYGLPLFSPRFEAWKYGVVIRYVHDKTNHYRDKPITELIKNSKDEVCVVIKNKNANFINEVWDKYKHYNGIELSDMICKKGFAWQKAVANGSFLLNDNDIRDEQDY